MPSILDMFSLASKTVVITGATGGIGVEISAALADAGADIVSLELPNDPLSGNLRAAVEKTGRKLTVYECNVRDDQSVKSAFAEIWKAGIIPDVLVNAAGITRIKPVEETTIADINSVCHTSINWKSYLTDYSSGHGNQLSGDVPSGARVWKRTLAIRSNWQNNQLRIHGCNGRTDRDSSIQSE